MDASPTVVAVRLFVLAVGASAGVILLTRRFALPYSVGLVAVGLVIGTALGPAEAAITPEIVLIVLLPGLIFEAAYQTDFRLLRSTMPVVALLAGPGVLVVAVLVAVLLAAATGLEPGVGFVVGAMVAATDPAAVISSFKRMGAPRRLATLVEAESLFNDGTGIVLFSIAVSATQHPVSAVDGVVEFVMTVILSALIGAVAGFLASRLVIHVDDHLFELSLSLALAYGTYLVADAFALSGIIATAVAGIMLGNYGRAIGMSRRTIEAIDTVWEFLAFLLTAIVFLLIGRAIPVGQLVEALPSIFWAIVAILLGRGLMVYGLGGILRLVIAGERAAVPVSWLHVTFWSGLRGAVSVALALSLPIDFPHRSLVQGITFGVVLFTLAVQATTAEPLIRHLGLSILDGSRRAEPDRFAS